MRKPLVAFAWLCALWLTPGVPPYEIYGGAQVAKPQTRDTTLALPLYQPKNAPAGPIDFVAVTPSLFGTTGLPGLWVTGPMVLGTSGTRLTRIQVFSLTITPVSVAATTQAEQTFTVTGLLAGDKVLVNPAPNTVNGVFLTGCRVSAANTLACTYDNTTAGALVPSAGTWTLMAVQ